METVNKTYIANSKVKDAAVKFYDNFQNECENCYEINFKLLLRILHDNKDSEYGKKYSFDEIKTYEDYKKAVPVVEYSDLLPYIDRIANGEKNILFSYPCNHLNLTSGTVGKQKRIPMTDPMTQSFYSYDKLYGDGFLYKLFGDEWIKGRTFAGVQGSMKRLPSGITVGDAEAVMADVVAGGKEEFNSLMSTFFCSPIEALVCERDTDFRYLHCLFALMDKNITGLVFGYLPLLVDYLSFTYDNSKTLIEDIRKGKLNKKISINPDSRKSIEARMIPNPERADELEKIFDNLTDKKFAQKVWPKLLYVKGVGGANFKVFTDRLKSDFFDSNISYLLSGITSSEGLYTVPVELDNEDGALTPNSVFFEFLPIDANGDFNQITNIEGLEVGKVYELIITNLSGFYRYRMSDCVKVVGYYKKSPRLRYMYRTTNVLNLCAEKTTEAAINQAFLDMNKRFNNAFTECSVCANTIDIPAHYDVFLEEKDNLGNYSKNHVQKVFEKCLCKENEEYEDTVDLDFGRLKILYLPPNTSSLYRDMRSKQGASPLQCKFPRILRNEEVKAFFYYLSDYYENTSQHYFIYNAFAFSQKVSRRRRKWLYSRANKLYAIAIKRFGKKPK